MVSVENAVIAKIHKNGADFEILIDPDKALDFKRGKTISIESALAVNEIFKDVKKGDRASSEDLQKAFGTIDILKVASDILQDGKLQLTTEQKRKITEEKRLEIASIISKQGVDPKTHIPHPQQRILNAMKEIHVDIDPFKPASSQVKEIINKIQEILPISFEKVTLEIRIPIDIAGRAAHIIREVGEIRKEEWKSDAWYCMITIPAGLQGDILNKINNITHGKSEVNIVKREEF